MRVVAGADSSILGRAGRETWAPMLEVAGGISAAGTAGEEQTAAGTAGEEEQTGAGTAGVEETRTAGEARTGVVLVVLAHMPVGSSWAGAGGSCTGALTVAGSCLPMEEGTGEGTGDSAGLACPPTA